MARQLGVSPAYVNLLENNQRSLSVQVLMALTEAYGVDMRNLVQDDATRRLGDLRAAVRDPVFPQEPPDIAELRAAIDHSPALVDRFLHLYQSHRTMVQQLAHLPQGESGPSIMRRAPETAIHDYFREHQNHFPALEDAAARLRDRIGGTPDDMYALLKRQLRLAHGLETRVAAIEEMGGILRSFDVEKGVVALSEALDHSNRVFQLAHILGLLETDGLVSELVDESDQDTDAGQARLKVELTNYFAAALLMPYDRFQRLAEESGYDLDRLAAAFGVSSEQVCHRLTTLQRDGARGVPFFFLRLDRAGNVTKRFNATPFTLAEQGGACPVWDIHGASTVPGVIVPQFVELPDGGRFFTVSRTSDRPILGSTDQARRVVVTIGCEIEHASRIGYARHFNIDDPTLFSPIGINCHVCPRKACAQRAHRPIHVNLPIDTRRRGGTRYES